MSAQPKPTNPAVCLPADLGVAQAEAFRRALAETVDADAPVTLDGSEVARVSTAALQLLLAYFRARDLTRRTTGWSAVSRPLADAAHWTGLAAKLRFPDTEEV